VRCKLAVAVVAVALMSVVGRLPADAATEPQKVYVAMGDSVTQWAVSERYPERFFSTLQQSGDADVLHNIGENGATSSSILGSQLTTARQLINDEGTDTTVVTVDIGGNDLLGSSCDGYETTTFSLSGCQPAVDTFATNFASLLSSLNTALAADPGSERLVVMAYYNPASGRAGYDTAAANFDLALLGADLKIDCAGSGTDRRFNDVIACVGRQQAALLADAHPPFVGKGDTWFVDSIHPNEAGQEAIAEVFRLAYSNLAPMADAGLDQDVGTRATFDLDAGGSSDPESGPLTYLWEQVGGPAAVIESPRSARTRVTRASGTSTLTFRVTVTDPIGATDTDEIVVKTK
jgi:lysophospholipase L1-like esterase